MGEGNFSPQPSGLLRTSYIPEVLPHNYFQMAAMQEVRARFSCVSFLRWTVDASGMFTQWGAAQHHHGPQDLSAHPSHKETLHTTPMLRGRAELQHKACVMPWAGREVSSPGKC